MRLWGNRRIQSSLVIVLLVVLALTTVLDKIVDLGMHTVNRECDEYLQDWTGQALATAATAAVINGGLSVIEDSEIQVQPAGLGASIALGDAVRPVNETASRLVSMALAGAVSLQIQKILIRVGAAVGLRWLAPIGLLFLLLVVWFDWRWLRRVAWVVFVLALTARFLLPGSIYITGVIGDHFTEATYSQTQQEFDELKTETTKTKDAVVDLVSLDGGAVSAFRQLGEVQEQLSALVGKLDDMAGAIGKAAVSLFAIFIVQTILMPLLILWGLLKLPGYLLDSGGTAGIGQWSLILLRGRDKSGGNAHQTRASLAEA